MKKLIGIILAGILILIGLNMPEFYGSESTAITTQAATKFHSYMISQNLDVYEVRDLNIIFRKLLHFSIYTLISILSILFMKKLTKRWWISLLVAPFLAVGVALADEKLQTMIPGRTGMMMDVMLDSLGVAFGVLIMLIVAITEDKK